MLTAPCPYCGAAVAGGLHGCQALWEQFSFRCLDDTRLAAVQMLAFDTYCMQHVEIYGVSAKSYVAHLTRLCVGVEHGGDARLYSALQRCYHSGLVKPPILSARGHITLADVMTQPDLEAQITLIRAWAADVWAAYESQHDRARQWVREVTSATPRL